MILTKLNHVFIFLFFAVFLNKSYAANFYWIGGSGNWSQTIHWSNTSGGATAGTLPSAADNVIFDNASGLLSIANSVNMDIPVTVTNFNFAAVSNVFTLTSGLASIEIRGSLSSNGLASIVYTGNIVMNSNVVGNFVLSNGTIWNNDFYTSGLNVININDQFENDKDFYVNSGGLNTSSNTFTCANFYSNTTNVRNINFGNSTIQLTGTIWNINSTSLTFNAVGSTLLLLNTGNIIFTGGSLSYDIVRSDAVNLQVYGNNDFGLADLSVSSVFEIENNTTQQIDSLIVGGDCGLPATIKAINLALAAASIEKTGYAELNLSNIDISKVNAVTGSGQVYNVSLSDTTNALNWTLSGSNFYWIGGGGNWEDENHWSFTPTGPSSGCIPGPADSVYFTNQSFTVLNDTVFVQVDSYFGFMDWSGVTNNPSLKLNAGLHAYGDMIFSPAMLVTTLYSSIEVNANSQITSNGNVLDCYINVNTINQTERLELQDAFETTDLKGILIMRGELHTNSESLTTGYIQVINLPSVDQKRIQLYNSQVFLKIGFNALGVTNEFVFDAGNSHVHVGDIDYQNYVKTSMAAMNFWDLTLDFHDAPSTQVVTGNTFQYHKLKINKGSHIEFSSLSVHVITDSLLITGTCADSIYMTSSLAGSACSFNKTINTNVIAECISLKDISAGGVGLTANYSENLGNNTNWTISSLPPATAAFTADGPFCYGDSTIFTNNSALQLGLTGTYVTYWNFGSGTNDYLDVSQDTTSNYYLNGGNYTVTMVTEYENFCRDTATASITIYKPNVFLLSSDFDNVICENVPVNFEASSSVPAVNFEYFLNGVSLNTPSPNDTLYSSSSLVDGDSISVVSYQNGCASADPAYMVFTVNDAPNFTWISSDVDTTICFGENVTFQASSLEPGLSYRYLLNGNVQTTYNASGFWSNNSMTNGNEVAVVAQNIGFCRDTLRMIITVNPLPNPTLTSDAASNVICANSLVTFTSSNSDSYEFLLNGVSQGQQASPIWSTSSLVTGDIVSVRGYTVNGCSKLSSTTYTYTVNPLPSISLILSDSDTSICSGTNVSFSVSGGTMYQMFINNIPQGVPSPTNIFNSNTIANNDQIYFEGGFSGCVNQSDTLLFEVLTSPTTTLLSSDANNQICVQESVTFTAFGATSYQFFINGISQGPSSATNVFTTSSILNGQTVTVVGESNTCLLSQALTFSVLPLPSVNLFSNDADNTICQGGAITFTAVNANNYQFFINGASQGLPSALNSISPTLPVGNNSVYVIGTAANGCSDTSFTIINAIVNPIPTILLSSSDPTNSICEGELITFTGSGAFMYQFFIDGAPQGSLSVTNTFATDNLVNGQNIYVTGSQLGCFDTSNALNFSVNSYPSVTLTSTDIDNIFCENVAVNFNASGATNYEFLLDGISQGVSSPVSTINSAGFAVGSYEIQVIGESNGCGDTAMLNVSVSAVPMPTILSSDLNDTICSGESISYSGFGGALYEFFVNGISQGPYSPFNSMQFNSLANGDIVSINATDATGCAGSVNSIPLTVNPSPNLSLISSDIDQVICTGNSVTFTANGANSYEFFQNGNSISPLSAVNTFTSNSILDNDQISVSGQIDGCWSNSVPMLFDVYNYPNVAIINNADTALCQGELTDLSGSGATSYQFSINGVPTGPFSANNLLATPLTNGAVVTLSGILNGCQSFSNDTLQFSVVSIPNLVSFVAPGTTICADQDLTVTATGGTNYLFELNGVLMQQGTTTSLVLSDLSNGDIVSVQAANGSCLSTVTNYTITVNEMNLNLIASPSNIICEGEAVTFTASGANQYQFYLNGSAQGTMSATNSFTSSSLTDLDIVSFNGLNTGNSCVQELDNTIYMTVISDPTISPQSSTTFCEGDSVILLSNSNYGNQWYLDGQPIAGATDTFYVAQTSGSYSLDVIQGGNGDLWSFGENTYGLFSDGTTLNQVNPSLSTSGILFDEIASGHRHMLGVSTTGQLYAWGDNEFGQLGDGTFADELSAQLLNIASPVKTIATAQQSNMALSNSGEVYVWGDNLQGQLGTGNTGIINFPFLNTNLTNIDTIAAGRNHFVLLKNDGTVWTVGNNNFGQLGQGNTTSSNTALQVSSLTNIIAVGAGDFTSFAISNSGQLYVWGNNISGQLGLGDFNNRLIPTISTLNNIVMAEGGSVHTLFLDAAREVYATGSNTYGQLGNGSVTSTNLPVKMIVSNVTQISTGEYTSILKRGDNSVFVNGRNDLNQLSSLSGAIVTTPELVPDADGVTFVEGGQNSTHFIFGNSASCSSTSINVTMLASPPVSVTADADTLSTVAGASYQWFLNDNPIPGSNVQNYIALVPGYYSVAVTFANGCVSYSSDFPYNIVGLDEFEFSYIVYPNPSTGLVNIQLNFQISDLSIRVKDMMGRIILDNLPADNTAILLDISSFSEGKYMLEILERETVLGRKSIIKTN